MAEFNVWITESAKLDLVQIYDHYVVTADRNIAKKMLGFLRKAIGELEYFPMRGSCPPELQSYGSRYRQLIKSAFRIVYRVEKNTVIILLVLHQKQSLSKALAERHSY